MGYTNSNCRLEIIRYRTETPFEKIKDTKGEPINWFHPLFILSLHREVKINFRYDRECLLSLPACTVFT